MAIAVLPTTEQITKMRETIDQAKSYKIMIDCDVYMIDSNRCFIVWDDPNELVHIITEYSPLDFRAAPDCIAIIRSASYSHIEFIEAYTDLEGGLT